MLTEKEHALEGTTDADPYIGTDVSRMFAPSVIEVISSKGLLNGVKTNR
jgi:hypothetical protein